MSTHTAKKHEKEEQSSSSSPTPESAKLNPGAPESPLRTEESDKNRGIKIKPVPSPGKQCFDIESHKITELFESSDVVFTREGGAGELRAQPKHEAKTRFIEIDGEIESKFANSQTTSNFKLTDGRRVIQKGHQTLIVDKDQQVDDAGPRLNIHAGDFQG